jgi:dCTP deaminase
MPKSDRWIRKMAMEHDMINPFSEKQVREGVISYGLSSYGYDLRVADEFKIFTNVNNALVDPKHSDEKSFVNITTDICIVPPNSFALARSSNTSKFPVMC